MPISPEELAAIAEALGLPSDSTYEDVLAAMAAIVQSAQSAANGQAPSGDAGAAAGDPTADQNAMAASVIGKFARAIRASVARRGTDKELVSLRTAVFTETDRTTSLDALNVIRLWKTSHATITAERQKLEEQRGALEASDRRTLVAELVTCGAETPATAWAKGADGLPDATKPAPIFCRMTLDELKEHVTAKKASKKAGAGGPPTPPAGSTPEGGKDVNVNGTIVHLSARELKTCEESKVAPELYAKKKLSLRPNQAAS